MNFKTLFSQVLEPIVRVHIMDSGPDSYGRIKSWADLGLPYSGPLEGVPKAVMEKEYDDGFGGAECPMFYLWTPNFVHFGTEYDGSTDMDSVPRNPM